MPRKIIRLSTILLLSFGFTGLQAQETVISSGGDASSTSGSVSYSIGQVVYTTNSETNGSVAQGVQQPYEISVVTGIDQAKNIQLEFTAYPNPTTDELTLRVDASTTADIQTLSYQLYDINGKLLAAEKITNTSTTISMVNYAPASYFLKITDNSSEVKTYKIIKK